MNLSHLELGVLYRITADDIDAVFRVITPGDFPLVLINGSQQASRENEAVRVVQLLGWFRFPEHVLAVDPAGFFASGEQPEMGYLYCVTQGGSDAGRHALEYLATDPTIERVEASSVED